ncbi:hypothetical protein [Glutamicibacter mysorens]|uniref:hypothetical protein n=1 Tax=Glutamicibacter mysorens TaxID=257984 RepID=UPI0020C5F0A1|nr:hypothetical protein [Glutamicibacter mysorens]UTM47195.1 hypothetical protein XH9_16970 [Glutamicibacter mysorens]
MQVQTDGLAVGIEDHAVEFFEDAGAYPLASTGAHRGRRTGLVGVLLLDFSQDESGQKFVEDDPVREAWVVST